MLACKFADQLLAFYLTLLYVMVKMSTTSSADVWHSIFKISELPLNVSCTKPLWMIVFKSLHSIDRSYLDHRWLLSTSPNKPLFYFRKPKILLFNKIIPLFQWQMLKYSTSFIPLIQIALFPSLLMDAQPSFLVAICLLSCYSDWPFRFGMTNRCCTTGVTNRG